MEIIRSVRAHVANARSVYSVHDGQLRILRPGVIDTQSPCEICAMSQTDVEASVASVRGTQIAITSMAAIDLDTHDRYRHQVEDRRRTEIF